MTRRIVLAITGAAGSIYGVRLLEELRKDDSGETHLVVSRAGCLNVATELDMRRTELEAMADVVHSDRDIGAKIASGSFRTDGMIVAPCSMKTLAAIATGLADNLVSRAADVVLKERRRLVLMVRETPLNLVHLRNMELLLQAGATILPANPHFYFKPQTVGEVADTVVARVLAHLGVENEASPRWQEEA